MAGRPVGRLGRVMDQNTGQWTYDGFMIQDDFGNLVDARGDGFDRDKTEGGGIPIVGDLSAPGSVFGGGT